MRNFKKFLALVLAMLMVSACAVSVSAAYTDQEAISASKFAEAVDVMSALGVFQGNENNEFGIDRTLRRDEAAKIAAVTLRGAESKNTEWTSATCMFSDVTGAWAYAYINLAFTRNIMKGVDTDNKVFNAEGLLNIDQALTIAVRLADAEAALRAEKNQKDAPAAYWAAYWINEAEDLGLTDSLGVIDYTQPCTRGMMAQILYNIVKMDNFDNDVAANFGLIKHPVQINYATDKVVNVTRLDVVDGEFVVVEDIDGNAVTLDLDLAACVEKVLASGAVVTDINTLAGSIATLTYTADGTLYGVTIDSTAKVFTHVDGKILNTTYGDNNKRDKYITIDGVKYVVGADERTASGIIGATGVKTPGIDVIEIPANYEQASTVWAAVATDSDHRMNAVPAYYSAIAYDDNGDNEFDRLVIKRYEIATIDYNCNPTDNKVPDGVTVDKVNFINSAFGTFTNYDGSLSDKNEKAIVYTGVVNEDNLETRPLLLSISYNEGTKKHVVDIMEAAKTETGVATNLKDDSYITLGTTKFEVASNKGYVNPAKWTLGQNVTIYTIGGKYVNVVNSSVEVGMSQYDLTVDNVTVVDGVALVDGYRWNSNGTVTKIDDLKVVGIVDNGKLLSMTAYENENKIGDKTYAGTVTIGTKNSSGAWTKQVVTFAEGNAYTFQETAAGAYFKGDCDARDISKFQTATETKNVEIKNGFFYVDGVAKYKMADSYSVLAEIVETDAEVAKNAYSAVSYKLLSSFKFETAKVKTFAKDGKWYAGNQTDNPVALVYATTASNAPVDAAQTKLNEGETIVKIVAVENEGLLESTYIASDIFTGAKVEVTGNAVVNNYAVVKDGKIVDADTLWVDTQKLTISVAFDGRTIQGYNTKIVDPVADGEANYLADIVPDDAKKVTFGLDAIKYWVYNTDGTIKEAGDLSKIMTEAGVVNFTGCIINGTVVILDTPVYAD